MKASMKEKDVAEWVEGTNFDNKPSRLITSASLSGWRGIYECLSNNRQLVCRNFLLRV